MRRKFIAKKNKNSIIMFKFFVFLILSVYILLKFKYFKLFKTNDNLITYIMESSNHLISSNLSYTDKISDISILLTNLDVKNPSTLFQDDFVYTTNITDNSNLVTYNLFPLFQNLVKNFTNITEAVVNLNTNIPLVYIYNTHQTEEYIIENNNIHNLTPNVYSAAYILKDLLEKKNIKTIVEDGNISSYLKNNNLNYDDSYIASRYYLEQAISKYPSVQIFIDLHRDALTHDVATIEYEGKKYAKVLFVVGLEHDNYGKNLDFANELNNLILENYSFLTRGILKKSGPLVNGIYNQDLSNRVILLEVGGNESTMEEVYNTLELISEIIYIKYGDINV